LHKKIEIDYSYVFENAIFEILGWEMSDISQDRFICMTRFKIFFEKLLKTKGSLTIFVVNGYFAVYRKRRLPAKLRCIAPFATPFF